MTRYLLSIYQPDGPRPSPEFLDGVGRDLDALNHELEAAGAWVFAAGLHPASSATVVRVREGEALMTDGPFAEGKEHLGGFTIIQAPDLDAALAWAERLARATTLPVEVRPMQGEEGPG
ncbi:MAG TPA: YciI family protein [Myxococcaceae bacterium]